MSESTPLDLSLRGIELNDFPKLSMLLEAYFDATPEVCVERARLLTQYHLEHGLLSGEPISIVDKAKAYRFALERREPVVTHASAPNKTMRRFAVRDSSPFAGSTTSKFKGVPLYPELIGLQLWPELGTMMERPQNPFYINDEEAEELNLYIFPPWIKHSILELARDRYYGKKPAQGDLDDITLMQKIVFFLTSKPLCISHTIPDFSRVLSEGLAALVEEARNKREATTDGMERDFYQAIEIALDGIITYSRNLAAKAQLAAAQEPDSKRKQQLLNMAEIYRWVPENPARTFQEALTTVWVCWIAAHLENPNVGLSLGRLDQTLYPYYEKDVRVNGLGVKRALELVCYFWLKIGDHVPLMTETAEQLFGGTGSNQAITLGGVTFSESDGRHVDAVNDLTYIMLRATELMSLRDPNVNARYHADHNTPEYLKRLCEVNIKTGATPAIHNDRAAIAALISRDDPPALAADYGVVGCVELCSAGRHYGHPAAILLNLPAVLEFTLYNGRHRHTGIDGDKAPIITEEWETPGPFPDMVAFRKELARQTGLLADKAVRLNNRLGEIHKDYYPTPILSALFEGPMEKGRDLSAGGAVINSSGVAVIGFADVADSLNAIETLVFKEKRLTLDELLEAMKSNFGSGSFYYDKVDSMYKSHEALQTHLSNSRKTPKFGNDDVAAQENVQWLAKTLHNTFKDRENYRGGKYRVGYWTMTIHAGFGRLTGALPNGRRAKGNFSSGITPVSKAASELTAALNSAARIPSDYLSSGVALNLRFTAHDGDHDSMASRMAQYVQSYCEPTDVAKNGGLEIQFNVILHNKLIAVAKGLASEEEAKKMLVRVSGYTAYFKDLNCRMQKEIIDRTEYRLSSGKMESYPEFQLDPKCK